MFINPVLRRAAPLVWLAAAAQLCFAVDTHVWEQSDQSDFARGTSKNLSIRSDGHVTLSPSFKELDSTTVPYLWAVVQDSKGTLYYAGGAPTGATAKIFALKPGGKPSTLAEIPGLEIHALAVDSHDRLYAAVLPDAKVYRIDNGKAQLFFDPKCKYIWAMKFDRGGNLYVATGDDGLIYKVAPDGKGTRFFSTNETHARSMAIDGAGNLIIGTDPGGLIIRVDPQGKGFVLYQAAKREITAVAERDGAVYAAAIGGKPLSTSVSGAAPVLPSNPPSINPTGAPRSGTPPPSLPPAVGSLSAVVSGGSDLYRIESDGFAQRIWSSPSDLIYAIAFDGSGKPIIGTGNKGIIYRIDSNQLSTELLNTPPTQVTAFVAGHKGALYAVTGNVGNLYSIGPGLSDKGTLESDVLDASGFSYWGKAHLRDTLHGGTISIETRSGNLNNPENDWSPWSTVNMTDSAGQIESPPARFLQYRLLVTCGSPDDSPDLTSVDIGYLPKNVAPEVQQIEIAPVNYREAPSNSSLERSLTASGSPLTISLPAVGQRRGGGPGISLEPTGSATLQYNKGWITARWSATDANGDPLEYEVELRGKDEHAWHVLKDKLTDRYYAFDGAAFPDGQYVIRVTASDAPGNIPSAALTGSLESDSFTIDNTPPELTDIKASHDHIEFTAADALAWIDKAEYSVDGGEWILLQPIEKVTDGRRLNYKFDVPSNARSVAIRVFDEDDNVVVKQVTP